MEVRILTKHQLILYRERKKMTQEQVAKLSGIKRPYYTMIETGKRRPSVDVAKKIAGVLDFEWTLFFALDSNVSLHEEIQQDQSKQDTA